MKLIPTLAFAALLVGSAGAFAAPKTCKVDITGNDAMQFDKKEIAIAADCTDVEVTLKHVGKLPAQSMGHNFVVAKTADIAAIATDGIPAGLANDYIKKGDARA